MYRAKKIIIKEINIYRNQIGHRINDAIVLYIPSLLCDQVEYFMTSCWEC